jgi:hypothetical protein
VRDVVQLSRAVEFKGQSQRLAHATIQQRGK